MSLHIRNRSHFLQLHGSTGLCDWDMDEELKLTTTTDQFCQDEKLNDQYLAQWHYARISRRKGEYTCPNQSSESSIQPNLWLMVNPSLACPIKYVKAVAGLPLSRPAVSLPVCLPQPFHTPHCKPHTAANAESQHTETLHCASSTAQHMLTEQDCPVWDDVPVYRQAHTRPKGRTTKPRVRTLGLAQKCCQRALQDSKNLKIGGWPRPPVNYCVLIAMALSSSHTGSLNVQQIYNFTREHFPFFQTAPDGWKNTIRHNLCFSNSFRKTPHQLCRDGKRKSCLWHLTLDGRRRLRDEIHTLTGEPFRMLKRSMSHPDVIHALFEL